MLMPDPITGLPATTPLSAPTCCKGGQNPEPPGQRPRPPQGSQPATAPAGNNAPRYLKEHQLSGDCQELVCVALPDDESRQPGEPSHRYSVTNFFLQDNLALTHHERVVGLRPGELVFQYGPTAHGLNGLTEAVLLAVLIDRLRQWQSLEPDCTEYAQALASCTAALGWLRIKAANAHSLSQKGA